jgi:hypothetical protein
MRELRLLWLVAVEVLVRPVLQTLPAVVVRVAFYYQACR